MSSPAPVLPDGLTTRPLQNSESKALFELIAAQELHDTGQVAIEEADLISDWALPGYDLGASSIGVFDGEELVAYAEHMRGDRADAAVRPHDRGRGIGTWLASWLRDLGRSRGVTVIGMPVPEGSDGDRLLDALGYRVRWTSWVLALPEGTTIRTRELPAGYTVREATREDYAAVHDLLEDAFLEWSDRERETFEAFDAMVLQRPGFAPWNARVVTDADGAVVAAAIVHLAESQPAEAAAEAAEAAESRTAYIARLGTRPDQRNRGLAQALLMDSFAAGREHGATVFELSTDSRTGALSLYEKVGMVVRDVWVNRAIEL